MHIVINARFLTQKLTGVQRFAGEISIRLKNQIPGLVFVAPHNIVNHELAKALDVKIIGKKTGLVWEQTELPAYLKKNDSPLLINFCNVAPLRYKNQMVTIHDLAFIKNPKWFNWKFVKLYKFLIPRIIKNSKFVFTVSNASKKDIIDYYKVDAEKIAVVYNGVSFKQLPAKTTATDKKYVLFVGSIDKRKNFLNLMAAFTLLKEDNLKLYIAGDINPIFNNTDDGSVKNESIHFLGRVSDEKLAELYTNALAFVYPSLYEGFGIPPLEAMFYGCPTVVSAIESLTEVCADASVYVDPLSPADIAHGISLIINDEALRNTLILKGKQNLARFSWESSANIVADHLNKYLH